MGKLLWTLLEKLLYAVLYLIVEERIQKIAISLVAAALAWFIYRMASGHVAWYLALGQPAQWVIVAGLAAVTLALLARLYTLLFPPKPAWRPIEQVKRK